MVSTSMKVLMVLTSHDQLGNTGQKTGFWLEEFASPYYVFRDAGATTTLASPKGGQPPLDPRSEEPAFQTAATARFRADPDAREALAHTKTLSSVREPDFDAIFFPGGHGPLWDLAENADAIKLIEAFNRAGKPVSSVCHAPAVFLHARNADGTPLVKGLKVTGFSNTEEAAVKLIDVVPFLVEDMLRAKGAEYSKGPDWQPHAVVDGKVVTGQNPASSEKAAAEVLKLLN
jgi:putative intracellular protease/amidase